MANQQDYVTYFEGLANTYLANSPTNISFYKRGLEEFLNGLTLEESAYPAMLLNRSDWRMKDNGYDSTTKVRTVAFVIFDHVDDMDDYDAITQAFENSEIIVNQIYNQIRADRLVLECQAFLQNVDLNSFQVSEVENQGDQNYGWFVSVDIESVHDNRITT